MAGSGEGAAGPRGVREAPSTSLDVEDDLQLVAQLGGLRARSARAQAVSSQLNLALVGLRVSQSPRLAEHCQHSGQQNLIPVQAQCPARQPLQQQHQQPWQHQPQQPQYHRDNLQHSHDQRPQYPVEQNSIPSLDQLEQKQQLRHQDSNLTSAGHRSTPPLPQDLLLASPRASSDATTQGAPCSAATTARSLSPPIHQTNVITFADEQRSAAAATCGIVAAAAAATSLTSAGPPQPSPGGGSRSAVVAAAAAAGQRGRPRQQQPQQSTPRQQQPTSQDGRGAQSRRSTVQQSSMAASQDRALKTSSPCVQKVPQLQLPPKSEASPSLAAQVGQEPTDARTYLDLAEDLVRFAISKAATPLGSRRRGCCSACALRAWQAWTAAKRLRAMTAEQLFLQRSRFQSQQLSGRLPLQSGSVVPSPPPPVIAAACWRAWRTQARAAARLLSKSRVAQMAAAQTELLSAGLAARCWVAWRRMAEVAGQQRRRVKDAHWTQCKRQLLQPALRGWSLWVLAAKADAQVKAEAAACADECLAAEVRLDQAMKQHAKQITVHALARQSLSERLAWAQNFALLTAMMSSWRLQAALLRAGTQAANSQKEAAAAAMAQCELGEQERFRQLQEMHDAELAQLQEKHSLASEASVAREAELKRQSSDQMLEIRHLREEMQRMHEMHQMQHEELFRWQHQSLEGNQERQQFQEHCRRSVQEQWQLQQQTLEELRKKHLEVVPMLAAHRVDPGVPQERQQLEQCFEARLRQQRLETEQQLEHSLQEQRRKHEQLLDQHRLQSSEQRESRCLGWERRWSARAAREEAEMVQAVLQSWGSLAGRSWRCHSAALERSAACDRGLLGWALVRACWALWASCAAEVRRLSCAEQRARCLLRPAQRRALQCAVQAAVALRREKQAVVILQAWRRIIREAEVRKWRVEATAQGDESFRQHLVVHVCMVSWCCRAVRSLSRRAAQRAAVAAGELMLCGHQPTLLLQLIFQSWRLLQLDSQYLQVREQAQSAADFETRAQHAYKSVQNCLQLQKVKLASLLELLGVALAGAQDKSLKSLVFACLARHAAAGRREAARVASKEVQLQLQVQLERQRSEFRKAAEAAAARLVRGQQRHQNSMASLGNIVCFQKYMSLLLSVWGRWRCRACGQAAAAAAQQLEILEVRCEELVRRLDWENSRWQQLDNAAEAQSCQEPVLLVEQAQAPMSNTAEASHDTVSHCAEVESQLVLEADSGSGILDAGETVPEQNWLDFSVPIGADIHATPLPSPQIEERSISVPTCEGGDVLAIHSLGPCNEETSISVPSWESSPHIDERSRPMSMPTCEGSDDFVIRSPSPCTEESSVPMPIFSGEEGVLLRIQSPRPHSEDASTCAPHIEECAVSIPICSSQGCDVLRIQSPCPHNEDASTYACGLAYRDKDKLHDVLQEVHQVQLELREKGWLEPQQFLNPGSQCCTPTSSRRQGVEEDILCADSSMQTELELAWSSQLGTRRVPGTPEDAPLSPPLPNDSALVEHAVLEDSQDGEAGDTAQRDPPGHFGSSPRMTFDGAQEDAFAKTCSPQEASTTQQDQIFKRINQSLAHALADLAPRARDGGPLCAVDAGPAKSSECEDQVSARFNGEHGKESLVDELTPGRFCFPGFEASPASVDGEEGETGPCRRASATKDHRRHVGRSPPRSISEGLARLHCVTSSLRQRSEH
eukprot:TRINITY_DN3377_c0_g1_i1.p1 TRINITY_DN3377_c0_g1~~TRINITY_DN3377_c0_g1_i1.p1  ORF type:complete len:1690 (+),score=361.18 TRINITY_DN3377_c0_g1_i1:77-5146(+)